MDNLTVLRELSPPSGQKTEYSSHHCIQIISVAAFITFAPSIMVKKLSYLPKDGLSLY